MHPTVRAAVAGVALLLCWLLMAPEPRAEGGARTHRGSGTDVVALTFHWDQSKVHVYVTTILAPRDGLLQRLSFASNNPGSNGAGNTLTFEVVRVLGGDAGFSLPLCSLTVPCTAPAGPGGHSYSSCGAAPISEGELFSVRISANSCATSPDGNVTIYGEL